MLDTDKRSAASDRIYAEKKQHVEQFSFNQQVVDVFPDMINRSVPSYRNIVDGIGHIAALLCPNKPTIYDLEQADLQNYSFNKCDLVALNFTLQFIPPTHRQDLIDTIYQALHTNGVFVLSEKIKHEHSAIDNTLLELHHRFKRENGYSDLEISQKRSALEDVMILDTIETHKQRLNKAGFKDISVWYQHYNFLSILAIK